MMNTAKFFSSGQESSTIFSSPSHTKQLSSINKKVIKIDSILKKSFSLRKQLQDKKVIKKSQSSFQEREKNLEKTKLPKAEKGIKSVSIPSGGGIFGWIGNFINNVIFGFIAVRLIEHLPKLLSLVPVINSVMDGIIDWGGKLLDGLVTFIDWGYSAYDNTVKVFSKFGGEGAAKKFEEFMSKFKDVLNYSIIAGMLFSDLALSGGGDQGYDDLVDINRNKPGQSRQPPRGGRPRVTTGRGGTSPRMRLSGGPKITGTGTKSVLKFVRPFTKRLPIIGALLDFGLSVALGENPGRAAFKAIGAGLLGAVGAALGGPFAILTGLAGGWLGDKAGGALYDAFFGNKKGKKPSSKKGWFGMRSGGLVRRYAGGGSTRGSQYLSSSARRDIKPQKQLRRVVTKPAKLYQGRTAGGIDNLQKVFPEPENIKSPPGTPSQRKDEMMNPYGFMSHSYYRFASVPFVGPILAMPLKVMMGDTIDSSYYTSVGQGFSGLMAKAYDEGAFSDDFPIQEFDFEKIVSKSVQQLATKEMTSVRSELMRQLGLEKLTTPTKPESEDCPCPDPSGGAGAGNAVYGDATDKAILDLISSVEAKDYDTMNVSRGATAGKPTQMTVDWLAANANGAIGRYQQMPQYVRERVIAAGGKGSDKFTPELQDRTALKMLYSGHGYARWRNGQMSDDEFGNRLSATWRGLPHSSGGTYPDQYAGRNKAHMSRDSFMASLRRIRGGASPVNAQIASSSPAGSVSDCSCDDNNIPDTGGITGPTNPAAYGEGKGKQIYLHWTAGSHSSVPRGSYHTVITGDGKAHNVIPYTQRGEHTYKRNTNSIGLSLAAMGGSPDPWSIPPTAAQLSGMALETAKIAKAWGWSSSDINIRNVLTHAEAGSNKDGRNMHENYGPKAWGGTGERWDLFHLNKNDQPGSGGDKIRNMIKSKMGSSGKFGGGPVNEGLTKVHPGEFVIDKDSVDVFGMEFMNIINQVENKSQLRRAKDSLIQILMEKVPYYSDIAPDEYVTVPSSGGGYSPNVAVLSGSVSGGGSDSCPWKDKMEFGN